MHPAFSVIFLTTLIGVGQGLFLALFTGQIYSLAHLLPDQSSETFYGVGSALALLFLIAGLGASFFHLGHPERAWRAATMWRTSWLSREVIVLPIFMALVFFYGLAHYMQWSQPILVVSDTMPVDWTLLLGVAGSVVAFVLFVCTAMIYASLKFLEEWHTYLTVVNYTLLGLASGFMLAAAFSAFMQIDLVAFYGTWAVIFTLIATVTRSASLIRNKNLRHKHSMASAIGVRHQTIRQIAQGFMGGSFNTREFFHHRSPFFIRMVKVTFLFFTFPLPIALIIAGYMGESSVLPIAAFVVQYLGLIAERWYFFAEAKHPQNLYYQNMA